MCNLKKQIAIAIKLMFMLIYVNHFYAWKITKKIRK